MTRINKIITFRNFTSIFIFTCLFLSLNFTQNAYAEMKNVSGTSEQINRLHTHQAFDGKTEVRFENNLLMYTSTDR